MHSTWHIDSASYIQKLNIHFWSGFLIRSSNFKLPVWVNIISIGKLEDCFCLINDPESSPLCPLANISSMKPTFMVQFCHCSWVIFKISLNKWSHLRDWDNYSGNMPTKPGIHWPPWYIFLLVHEMRSIPCEEHPPAWSCYKEEEVQHDLAPGLLSNKQF